MCEAESCKRLNSENLIERYLDINTSCIMNFERYKKGAKLDILAPTGITTRKHYLNRQFVNKKTFEKANEKVLVKAQPKS